MGFCDPAGRGNRYKPGSVLRDLSPSGSVSRSAADLSLSWSSSLGIAPRRVCFLNVEGAERITYTQGWDVENRLSVVTNTVTGEVTRFTYDGDGKRVLREDGSGVTVYLSAVEVHGTGTERVTRTYYHAGDQRIAMRESGEVTYLHSDHLGSASLATDATGALLNEMRYTPYGVTRSGDVPTDRRYTDQRWESGLGLYDYGARFYSAALGRFVSADTIVPNPQNPQDFNRYSYVRNNALKYTDPSGHIANIPGELTRADEILQLLLNDYAVTIDKDWGCLGIIGGIWNPGSWELAELEIVLTGVTDLANLMGGAQQFRDNLGGVKIMRKIMGHPGEATAHEVWLRSISNGGFSGYWEGTWTVVHELAHAWDAANGWQLSKDLEKYTGGKTRWWAGKYIYGGIPSKGADGNFNRREDFAESVTTFIYPKKAQDFIQSVYANDPNLPLYQYSNYYSLPRAAFVAQQVNMDPTDLHLLRTWNK